MTNIGAAVLTALNEMMNAVNAGDAPRYARLYAPDAVITIFGSGELKGRSAIEQHEVELMRQFPGARLAFYAVWTKGPVAVVHYGVNGRTPAGQAMGHEGLLFYRFDAAGLIADERRYLDSLTPMAQLGLLGAVPARPLPKLPTSMNAHRATGSPTEEAGVAAAKRSLAALDAGDERAFLAGLTEDVVIDDLTQPQPLAGKRSVKTWLEAWTGKVPKAKTEVRTILGVGPFVLVETIVRSARPGPAGPASGAPFTVHRAAILQLEDGRLSRMSVFMNGKELAPAAPPPPPPE